MAQIKSNYIQFQLSGYDYKIYLNHFTNLYEKLIKNNLKFFAIEEIEYNSILVK